MFAWSSIPLLVSLTLSHGNGTKTESRDPDPVAVIVVTHEDCPNDDPFGPLEVAKGLRKGNRFAEAIICEVRAYGACLRQEGEDRSDCDHIGDRIGDDLGFRSAVIIDNLYEVSGPGDEAYFATALEEARLFVATLKAELDRSSTAYVPVRVIDYVVALEQRVDKLARAHERQAPPPADDKSQHEGAATPTAISAEPPRIAPGPPLLLEPVPTDQPPTNELGAAIDPDPKPARSALIGSGIGSLAVGVGLSVAGMASWRASSERLRATRDRLAAPAEISAAVAAELLAAEQLHHRSMRASVVLLSVGAGAVAAGVALTTLGARRGRSRGPRANKRQLSIVPGANRGAAGIVVSGRF